MSQLPLEQPPVEGEDSAPLKEWLTRMMILINGAFATLPKSATLIPELIGVSFVTQEPTVLDVPVQVSFGDAQDLDRLSMDADGTITIKVADQYDFFLFFSCARTGTNMEAYISFYAEVNGFNSPNSFTVSVTNANEFKPMYSTIVDNFKIGDVLKIFMVRDGSGVNEGGLLPFITAGASIPDTPSARIVIKRAILTE